jgi:phage terminase small subunit
MSAAGLSGSKIAEKLLAEHGCRTTARSIQRFLQATAKRQEKVAVPDTDGLTGRQVRFVEEYLLSTNASDAARKAGYSAKTAASQGADLLKNPKVRAALDKAINLRAIRVGVKADDVLGEFLRIARADIGQAYDPKGCLLPLEQMPEEVRRGISGIEVEELYEGRGNERVKIGNLVKVRFWDKVAALTQLGKHLQLFHEGKGASNNGGGEGESGIVLLPPEGDCAVCSSAGVCSCGYRWTKDLSESR